jgi:7-keto-8-aminopelargonate synthetase-like enzyme
VAGVKATGCFVVPFVHNDCDLLEKLLRQKGNLGKTVVVTESVFSTEGSIAPFNRINELCEQYGALPVIDDSHGIGVIGRNGAGILDYSEIYNYSGLYTASLGRAMANSGGIVAGRECVIEGLRYRCPGIVYSSGIAPAVAAGVIHVLDRIEQEYRAMRKRLQDNVEIFDTVLTCQGYPLSAGTAPVLAVQCGSRKNTLRFTHQLYASRILATPFVEPSVQLNCGIVRLIPGAGMSREACRAAAATIEAIVN